MTKPCPECEKQLPKLPAGNAPVVGCNCRICRWLRDNAAYEGPKRGYVASDKIGYLDELTLLQSERVQAARA